MLLLPLLDGVLTAELPLVVVEDLLVAVEEDDELLDAEGVLVVVDDLLVAVEDELLEELAAGVLVVVLDLLVAVLELVLLLDEVVEAGLETLELPEVLDPPEVLELDELVVVAGVLLDPLVLLVFTSDELEEEVLVEAVFEVDVLLDSVDVAEVLRFCASAEFVASISIRLMAIAVVRYLFIVPWFFRN